MHWEDVPAVTDDWVAKAAAPAYDVRQRAASVIAGSHVGYYFNPESDRVGVFAPLAEPSDLARFKYAAAAAGPPLFLSYRDLADPAGTWVKVAYSPALRRAGELLNFFPGQYPGGVPNSPSPLAAMLTSGLVGAGLGWGGGKLLGKVLPRGYGDNLWRTGAVVGGLLGASGGAAWGGTNKLIGRDFNDPMLTATRANEDPVHFPLAVDGANAAPYPGEQGDAFKDVREHLNSTVLPRKFAADLEGVALGEWYAAACKAAGDAFGGAPHRYDPTPIDVNIDALGRTLWDAGASPALAASAMGGMYAAQQMPDARSRPGWATAHQLGALAQNATGDYAKGLLVGVALNRVVGTPFPAAGFGAANAVLGLVGAVVPKLFGG